MKRGSFPQIYGSRIPEPNQDAFGRLRISEAVTLFDSQNQYDKMPYLWSEITNGAGRIDFVVNESTCNLYVSTANGDYAIRQSREYFRYQPGKSQLVMMTYVFGESSANNFQRVGYYDKADGIFLEYANNVPYMCLRSNTTGTPTDTRIPQSQWNIDKLDGTSDSNVTIDMAKSQIFIADMEWLGVGRVRTGFVINGGIYYAHEFLNANEVAKVYMKTATLPVRYEIKNTGTAVSTNCKSICATVISEGGVDDMRGVPCSASTNVATRTVNSGIASPVLAIRPNTSFNGLENRTKFIIDDVNVISDGKALIEIRYNPTLGAANNFVPVANSAMMVDVSADTVSGGHILTSFYTSGTNQSVSPLKQSFGFYLPVTVNYHANSADTIVVCAKGVGGGTTALATINWRELR
jgi:hypothetical protein